VVIPDIKPRKPVLAPVTGVAYDATGSRFALARHNLLELVDLPHRTLTEHPQPGKITALAFAPRGANLAVAFGSPGASGSVHIRGAGATAAQTFDNLHKDAILDVAVSPDGKLLATCSYDTQVKLTPLQGQLPARVLKDHSDAVYGVAFSP